MKKTLILIIILILILVGLTLFLPKKVIEEQGSKKAPEKISEEELYGKEKSEEIVRNWILENSLTYKFDGFNLEFKEVSILRCPFCYEFIFEFKSRHAGYGDRTDEILAQAITLHTISVITEKGRVTRAISDEIYDEIEGKFLDSSAGDMEQLANPASVYCVGQGGSLEIRTNARGGQYGICIFNDGSECEEWAFFRGECSPKDSSQ